MVEGFEDGDDERRGVDRRKAFPVTPIPPGRWGKLTWLPFETTIALLYVVVGINAFLNPIGPVPAVDYPSWFVRVTGVVQVISGAMIFVGLWKMKQRVEMLGLVGILTATFGQTMAAILLSPGEVAFRSMILFIISFGCVIRLNELLHGHVMIMIGRGEATQIEDEDG